MWMSLAIWRFGQKAQRIHATLTILDHILRQKAMTVFVFVEIS
jgi:hypothetical protein